MGTPPADEERARALRPEAAVEEAGHVAERVDRHPVGLREEPVLEADHRVLDRGAVDGHALPRCRRQDPGLEPRSEVGEQLLDREDGALGERGEGLLHELLEPDERGVREEDVVDPVDLVVAERDVRAVGRAAVVGAPDRLDHVVGQVRAGRDEHVDVAALEEVRDDPAHAGRDHRAGEAEEPDGLRVGEHPLPEVDGPGERTAVVGAGPPECVHERPGGHAGTDLDLPDGFTALHRDDHWHSSMITDRHGPPRIQRTIPRRVRSLIRAGQDIPPRRGRPARPRAGTRRPPRRPTAPGRRRGPRRVRPAGTLPGCSSRNASTARTGPGRARHPGRSVMSPSAPHDHAEPPRKRGNGVCPSAVHAVACAVVEVGGSRSFPCRDRFGQRSGGPRQSGRARWRRATGGTSYQPGAIVRASTTTSGSRVRAPHARHFHPCSRPPRSCAARRPGTAADGSSRRPRPRGPRASRG